MKNLYCCFHCDEKFSDPTELRAHNYTHPTPPNFVSKYATRLKKHELIKIDISDVNCKLCSDSIQDFQQLKIHLNKKHNKDINSESDGVLPFRVTKDTFKCALCDKVFEEFKSLNHHMNIHYQNFICEQCGAGFITPDRLRVHSFSHETGNFKCDAEGCDKIFRSKNNKNEHYAIVHMRRKRHRCPQCSETFINYFQRSKHISTIHGVKLKEFKCDLCPKIFTLSGKLKAHIQTTHLKMKRFSCEVCSWKVYSKAELKQHMVKHMSFNRRFQCHVCEKAYARSHTLKEHMKVHETVRRFVCGVCGKTFVQACSLNRHSKTHLDKCRIIEDPRTITTPGRRIVPLFQVAYDRTLCKPLGTITDFSKLRNKGQCSPNATWPTSRSPSPMSPNRSPSPLDFEKNPPVKFLLKPEPKKNNTDAKQNALTIFEFSTAYPFIFSNNKFKCFVCSQPFLDLNPLKQHMNEHAFTYLRRLMNNRKENVLKVDVSDLSCKICSTPINDLVMLKSHLKESHGKAVDTELQDNLIPFNLNLFTTNEGYQCVICNQHFIKLRILVIHMSAHFSNYSCEICGSGFMTLRLLKKHLEVHETGSSAKPLTRDGHELNMYVTAQERENAVTLLEFTTLTPFTWLQGSYKCFYCEQMYPKLSPALQHIKSHVVPDRTTLLKVYVKPRIRAVKVDTSDLKCKICNMKFSKIENISKHLVTVHNKVFTKADFGLVPYRLSNANGNVGCYKCDKEFNSFTKLNRHMNVHENIVCEVCGSGFMTMQRLIAHRSVHIKGHHKCNQCQKVFSTRWKLQDHIIRNHEEKNSKKNMRQKCPNCLQRFQEYYQKVQHMRDVHGITTEVRCETCKVMLPHRRALTIHTRRLHLQNITCKVCGKCFGTPLALRIHSRGHTGERNFSCTICHKTYMHEKLIRNHMRTHGFKVSCVKCGIGFMDKMELKKHKKERHNQLDQTEDVMEK